MNQPPSPVVVRRRRTLPLIWIVPLIALVVGGWLITRHSPDRGPEIMIRFHNGAGIEAGRTMLEHKGVAVGTVESVALDDKLDIVLVKVRLAKHAASLARADSEFWLVRPEIGFSGIKGLDTLFTGTRLKVRPGHSSQPATEFTALRRAPLLETSARGRSYVLRADRLGALTSGAPVFFREIKVGFVEAHRLTPDADGVLVRIRVRTPYDQLIRPDTRFWNSGGVSVKVGLLGAEIRSNSLESLISGGVAFATPDSTEVAPAPEGTEFPLADEVDKDWLKWKPKIPIEEDMDGWETNPEPEPTR